MSKQPQREESTLTALLREKPKRGRPRHAVSRQSVYVALTVEQKELVKQLAETLNEGLDRSDIPDMAVMLLAVRLEALRRAVSDRDREMPEGITVLDSLYLLWDVPLPLPSEASWTSIRLSPQQIIQLGRSQGLLHALFNANRSEVFSLGLGLLKLLLESEALPLADVHTLNDFETKMTMIYL
ncbi:MAG: hypothetical protein KA314_08425 [Chloroflexi bacterium]|nr:hypothetical protein [Chloroflexota bacterium]MBP8055854.1 hypothetical protein [Chloroflexota bacterium]